jgi:large subunit ribosomal protein L13
MILIDGKGSVLGRLATFAAKSALKGEEVKIVNVDKIIITGNKLTTKEDFKVKRSRVGHSQKGPKHPATSEKIVKRAIRGMLPNHREGRGREAFKRIFCYSGVPKEFEDKDMIVVAKDKKIKYAEVRDFARIK